MSGDTSPYLALVTSQHRLRPKYSSMVSDTVQAYADTLDILRTLYSKFDLDFAVGAQLDTVGLWIGRSRLVFVPIDNVFFSFDTSGQGFNQAVWFGPANPNVHLVALPDFHYRLLLKAVAAENVWDGSIPQMYAVWDIMFAGTDITLQIIDHQNMTMEYVVNLNGQTPDSLTQAIIQSGYLALKPAGVSLTTTINP